MQLHIALLSLLTVAPIGFIALPGLAQNSPQECSLIGRLQSGASDNYGENDIVCSGAEIINPVAVEFLCFQNRRIVPVSETTTINSLFCSRDTAEESSSESTQCDITAIIQRWLCAISKGPEGTSQFTVLQPDVISGPRPQIAWEEIEGADTYTVYVAGPDVRWQHSISAEATELAYPETEPSLSIGLAYEVLVTASSDVEQIATSIPKTINVSNTAQRIEIQLAARVNEAQ